MSDDLIDDAIRDAAHWAARARETLTGVGGGRVHFRPSSGGVSMIGLHPDAPQQGSLARRDLGPFRADFAGIYARDCLRPPGRVVPEKHLQSFLVGEALQNDRAMRSLDAATGQKLRFITDELAIVREDGKLVCDLLALRVDGGRCTPVVIELKTERQLKRLVEQVSAYAALVDRHRKAFSVLFSAVLGAPLQLEGPTEKWIVWPPRPTGGEPHAEPLAAQGIGVLTYERVGAGYSLACEAPLAGIA